MLLPTKSPQLEKFMQAPRVYLIDNEQGSIHSLAANLAPRGFLCEPVSPADAAHERFALTAPSCVVVHAESSALRTGDAEREGLLEQLHRSGSPAKVVVVAESISVQGAVALMQAGAHCVLERPVEMNAIVSEVERATLRSKQHHENVVWLHEFEQRYEQLESQQRDVLDLLLAGKTSITAANKLNMSTRTVDRRRRSILKVMQVKSLPELAVLMGRRYQEMQNRRQAN